jgi:CBS domain containing-hemolysin-like protein
MIHTLLTSGTQILAAAAPTDGEVSGTVGGLLFFFLIAIGFSFLCSLLEASILSTPPSYVEAEAHAGTRAGRLFQKHKQSVDEPITAILTLNTFAHTIGAAGAGAQAVGVFGTEWAFLITVVLTLFILILSEIIPKTIGALYWQTLFPFTAYTVQVLIIVLYPAVKMFRAMTRLMAPDEKLPTISRGEIEMMASIGATEGALKENEGRVLRNLLHLNEINVGDIMTPRTVILAFQQDATVDEVLLEHRVLPYSRIPIFDKNTDDIVGFVLRYDILQRAAADEDHVQLRELLLPLHSVPETLSVAKVLDEFMLRQQHIFLVFDEYGGTAGLVTLEDAVESLLGREITDESDLVTDTRKLAQQRYMRQQTILEASRKISQSNGLVGKGGYGTPIESQTDQTGDAEPEETRPT